MNDDSFNFKKINIEKTDKDNPILFDGIKQLINNSVQQAAIYLNQTTNKLYWSIGNYILKELKHEVYSGYGKQIIATLSQQLTQTFGKGYSYSALTRMIKVADNYSHETFATLSQTLSWSHFIELVAIKDKTQRLFYQQMCVLEHWSVRTLRDKQDKMLYERTIISKQPENVILNSLEKAKQDLSPDLVFKSTYILDFLGLNGSYSEKDLENTIMLQLEQFILELGQGFAFLERQKRISIDSTDYYLDLLFYHRKLNRLIAIDLKLGKFKPAYKAQMELYLRYLQKHEQQANEQSPIGLLLCSEGNTEHIELLLLDEENIKVAQYLTALPDKKWFTDKLQKAIELAKEQGFNGKLNG